MFSATISILVTSALIPVISAHSWNEQLSLIGTNGSYTAANGYPRGYVARTDPGYNGNSMEYLLPPLSSGRTRVDSTDLLCHPNQRSATQSPDWPRLTVSPGSVVAMKYLENGHVTLPQNQPGKPPMAGSVYVFGTTQPLTDEKLTTVMAWNSAGTSGDKRGQLLAAQNFDDGRCHQLNSGSLSLQRQQEFPDRFPGQPTSQAEQWCETDLNLPTDLEVGKPLTIYWIWQWPTAPGAPGLPDGKDEYYTTCSDFDVEAQEPNGPVTSTLLQQDPQTTACLDYKSRTAITPIPHAKDIGSQGAGAEAASPTSGAAPAAAVPTTVLVNMGNVAPSTLQTLVQTQAVDIAGSMPASTTPGSSTVAAVGNAVVTLTPGQGVMMGANGEMVTFALPAGAAAPTGVASPAKVKRDFDDETAPDAGPMAEDVAMEVSGSHRYRMPRWSGGSGHGRAGGFGYRKVRRAL